MYGKKNKKISRLIIGLLFFFVILVFASRGLERAAVELRLRQLNKINQTIYRDYVDTQRLLLSRHWLGKGGFYAENNVKKILDEKFIRRDKLLVAAERIAHNSKIEIMPQSVLMPYFYKEEQRIILGFLSNSCAWIEIGEAKITQAR